MGPPYYSGEKLAFATLLQGERSFHRRNCKECARLPFALLEIHTGMNVYKATLMSLSIKFNKYSPRLSGKPSDFGLASMCSPL